MNVGDKYYTYYRNNKTGFLQVTEATWEGSMIDYRREDQGRIFKSMQEATRASGGQVKEIS